MFTKNSQRKTSETDLDNPRSVSAGSDKNRILRFHCVMHGFIMPRFSFLYSPLPERSRRAR